MNKLCALGNDLLELFRDILYAGVVGSSLVTDRADDIDIVVIVGYELRPRLFHPWDGVSVLAFDSSWLDYGKHENCPVGLIPSILFKGLSMSLPIFGSKSVFQLPPVNVCDADWVNLGVKKARYLGVDRKNYLVALIFEKLLERSSDLDCYSFDNIAMAKGFGLNWIAEELEGLYVKNSCNKGVFRIQSGLNLVIGDRLLTLNGLDEALRAEGGVHGER